MGKDFGPKLDDVGSRFTKPELIRNILWPNASIAKGYETVQVLTIDGAIFTGFVLGETDKALTLGVASQDGKGHEQIIQKNDIELRKEMKASSMPEGLVKTIAPSEFLDLVAYLSQQTKFVLRDDGWIETGSPEIGELRTHGEWPEISRDAQVQLGLNYPDQWKAQANLLLSATDSQQRDFVFHSPNEGSESPAIAIRLAQDCAVAHIDIENRRTEQFHGRAKDLAVWISSDGQQWKQVWKSDRPASSYAIDLSDGSRARYIKIGLDGPGILHLNQVVVYGKRL